MVLEEQARELKKEANHREVVLHWIRSRNGDNPALVEVLLQRTAFDIRITKLEVTCTACIIANQPKTLHYLCATHRTWFDELPADVSPGLLHMAYHLDRYACIRVLLRCHPCSRLLMTEWLSAKFPGRPAALQATVALFKALRQRRLDKNVCAKVARLVWKTREDHGWLRRPEYEDWTSCAML